MASDRLGARHRHHTVDDRHLQTPPRTHQPMRPAQADVVQFQQTYGNRATIQRVVAPALRPRQAIQLRHVIAAAKAGDLRRMQRAWRRLMVSRVRTGGDTDPAPLIEQVLSATVAPAAQSGQRSGVQSETSAPVAEQRAPDNHVSIGGDDTQLANIPMQDMLQKQQQTLRMMSQISKTLHDTAMAVIRKMGG